VALAHRTQESLCNDDQQLVADTVPVHVVDLLEAVEIEQENRMGSS